MDINNNMSHLVAWHVDAIMADDDLDNVKARLLTMHNALLTDDPFTALHAVIDEEFAAA